jgi:hypothetical protein
MLKSRFWAALSSVLIIGILSGCSGLPFLTTPTPTPTLTNTPLPTNTPIPSATPTATPVPYFVSATVMSGEIQAPAILYHHFAKDTHAPTSTYTRYSDFKAELQKLYDAGYSLVSMSSWLDGTFSVPAGRKPLLFTLDDGIFADQLYIDPDGTPSVYSGLGILYQFSKDHPDFGFAASIYVNMGDKFYGDLHVDDWFYVSEGNAWKTKLANTMVWMIENNIEIYNHTYTHIDFSLTKPADILYQLKQNDDVERQFLAMVNRSDLDTKLGNIVALPFGTWPATKAGMDILLNYRNPEKKPLSAILEAYNADEPELTPSLFSPNYDRMKLPRITSTVSSIDWVAANNDKIPTANPCKLGPTSPDADKDPAALQTLITAAVQSQTCPEGLYHVNNFIFLAQNGTVKQYTPPQGDLPTQTSTP